MMGDFLILWTPGPIELIVILVVLGIPFLLIALFIRYLSRIGKERQKFRLELGKLAEELQQMKKQKQQEQEGESSAESD
jgi:hypothetical protein